MPPVPIAFDELKKKIVGELNIGHLADVEQEEIVTKLSEVLLKDATLAVMQQIPESEHDKIDAMVGAGDDTGMQDLVRKYVPNVEQVVAEAVRAGIDEHKRLVTEEVAKATVK